MKEARNLVKQPTTADAEKWLDPDVFVYDGEAWVVDSDFKVRRKSEGD